MNRLRSTRLLIAVFGGMFGSAYSAAALAAEDVRFTITAEKEVVETQPDGTKRFKTVVADSVLPGEEVVYTIFFKNISEKRLGKITVTDPIPADMRYVGGTAFGPGTSISYSIDGGQTYGQPSDLRVVAEESGRKRMARPEEYTHVRWVYQDVLEPSDKAYASYRAVLR